MTHATVLVVEDNALTRKMVRVALQKGGYQVHEAGDGATAIAMLEAHRPALVLQDLHLPDMDGVTLVRALRALPAGEGIPILAFSGLMSKMEEARTLRAGFTDYLFKPVEPSRLVAMVNSYLAIAAGTVGAQLRDKRILLVDDDALQGKLNALQLRERGFVVELVTDASTALEAARRNRPDAIVTDLLMPGMTGMELCLAIRRDPELALLPVVITSSTFAVIEDVDRQLALEIGADAFVERTPGFTEVIESLIEALQRGRPQMPGKRADAMSAEFLARLIKQLEHQAAINASLVRQAAMHSALLSIMAGAAEILTGSHDLPTLLEEVLARALDAGGVSAGAIYLRAEDGGLELRAQLGFQESAVPAVKTFFGEQDLLRTLADGTHAVEIPSAAVDATAAQRLLTQAKTTAVVVAPLVTGGRSHGALVLRASSRDLGESFLTSVASVAAQLGQAVALSDTMARLGASEERYRSLFEGVPTGVFRVEGTGEITEFNAELMRLIGTTDRAGLVGTNVLDLYLDPADRMEWRATLQSGREIRDAEFQMRRSDGTSLWVSLNVRSILGPAGDPLYHEGTLTDVNDRKLAETELAAAQARLGQVVASSDAVIYLLRATGKAFEPEWISDNMMRITGHEGSDVMQFDWWSNNVHPEDLDRVLASSLAVLKSEQAIQTYRFRRGDDSYMWLRDSQRLVRDADGKPSGIVGALVDITEQKSLETQLVQAQKMEAIGQLAAGVAHDFNNVLTVITGFGGMLQEDLPEGDARRQDVEEILGAATRANALTKQLLAFGRRQVLQPVVLDLNEALARTGKMVRRLIGEHIAVVMNLDPEPLPVLLDPSQLEQVLLNLAVNARDAMSGGGTLVVESRRIVFDAGEGEAHGLPGPGEYAILHVKDSGIGMDSTTQSRIFEPFYTTKEKGKGTGLGLSTVYGIVTQSGGNVLVASEPGLGTTFTILFPVAPISESVRNGAGDVLPPLGNGKLVLLVEDDAAVRQYVAAILTRNGYRVIEAADGHDAIACARQLSEPIAVLLSDVIMPGLNGPQVYEQLLALQPGLPAIFMSGYAGDVILNHGVLDPGLNFLEKPFPGDKLLLLLGQVLGAESG